MAEEFKIGSSFGAMLNLADLTVPVEYPFSTFTPFSSYLELGDGNSFGMGSQGATWTFPTLSVEARNQLRHFCSGTSSDIYIRSKLNDDTYLNFVGIMKWPESEKRRNGYKEELTISFSRLVSV
jgi:hypothetical protein